MSALSGIPDVALEVGRSRYILLKVYGKDDEEVCKYIVRGSVLAAHHTEVRTLQTYFDWSDENVMGQILKQWQRLQSSGLVYAVALPNLGE